MKIDRTTVSSQITQGKIEGHYHILSDLIAPLVVDHIKKSVLETTAQFLNKDPSIDTTKNIIINFHVLEPEIKKYLDSKLYELLHSIFSNIYPKLEDDEMQVLQIFPVVTETSAAYSNAHRHFDSLLIEHSSELVAIPDQLEKGVCAFIADKAIKLIGDEAKKQTIEKK